MAKKCCMTTVLYTSLISGYGEHWSFMKDSIHTHTHTERNVLAARMETRKLGDQNCTYFFLLIFALYQLQK